MAVPLASGPVGLATEGLATCLLPYSPSSLNLLSDMPK